MNVIQEPQSATEHAGDVWRDLVEKALKSAPFESLTSRTLDGVAIAPLYLPGDAPAIGPLPRSADWVDIRSICTETDPDAANGLILGELEGGATSISLQLEAPGQTGIPADPRALEAALDGVDLKLAQIWLTPGEQFEAGAAALDAVWREAGIPNGEAAGGYGADPLGVLARNGGLDQAISQSLNAMAALAGRGFRTHPGVPAVAVDASLYHDAGASEAEELACMAATFVCYLRALEEGRLSAEDSFRTTEFTLAVDCDLLLSMAKFRAARLVLARIAEETDAGSLPVRIRAISSRRMMTRYDPHTNMLRMMVACAAAIMGGADAVTIRPHTDALGAADGFARRVARNMPIVLQEESFLAKVADPAAGSYALDHLTDAIAAKAWERLREIEGAGGMVTALQSGMIQRRIAESADARSKNIATGKIEIIGINAFAELDEPPPVAALREAPSEDSDNPAVTVEPLPLRRDAEAFEALREASDAYLSRTGKRPSVWLATLGSPKEFAARAGFARSLFASGGIAAIEPGKIETASSASDAFRSSGAKIACLCSSDEVYEGLAEPVARALKSAGADYVLLSGRPGDRREALRAAGIEGFMHKGCDQVAVLSELLDRLGARTRA